MTATYYIRQDTLPWHVNYSWQVGDDVSMMQFDVCVAINWAFHISFHFRSDDG